MRGSNWPTAVLTSAFGLHHESRKLHMAVCVGYLEANTHHAPDTMTVIGLVSPKARWQAFEERWPHALHTESLTAFNGRDFIQRLGEFSAGWPSGRRARCVAALSKVASDSVFLGVSYSLRLADYRAAAKRLPHADVLPSPYGVCAGVAMSRILRWMARVRSEDVTLCVFEDGGIDHRQVRQVAAAEGVDHGEPVQIWPREWRDERDRRRLLRPLEACDLLMAACGADLIDRLRQRSAWDEEQLDRDHSLKSSTRSLPSNQCSSADLEVCHAAGLTACTTYPKR